MTNGVFLKHTACILQPAANTQPALRPRGTHPACAGYVPERQTQLIYGLHRPAPGTALRLGSPRGPVLTARTVAGNRGPHSPAVPSIQPPPEHPWSFTARTPTAVHTPPQAPSQREGGHGPWQTPPFSHTFQARPKGKQPFTNA